MTSIATCTLNVYQHEDLLSLESIPWQSYKKTDTNRGQLDLPSLLRLSCVSPSCVLQRFLAPDAGRQPRTRIEPLVMYPMVSGEMSPCLASGCCWPSLAGRGSLRLGPKFCLVPHIRREICFWCPWYVASIRLGSVLSGLWENIPKFAALHVITCATRGLVVFHGCRHNFNKRHNVHSPSGWDTIYIRSLTLRSQYFLNCKLTWKPLHKTY